VHIADQERRVMDARHFLFSFDGRISRLEWWGFSIPYAVFLALLYWAESSFAESGPRKTYVAIAIFVVYAVALYMWLAVNVKRCHDRGHFGWFVLLGLIPLVNIWYVIEVCFPQDRVAQIGSGRTPRQRCLAPSLALLATRTPKARSTAIGSFSAPVAAVLLVSGLCFIPRVGRTSTK
jgi:uncharacterized membrane protein YhaH (DUF805 family)